MTEEEMEKREFDCRPPRDDSPIRTPFNLAFALKIATDGRLPDWGIVCLDRDGQYLATIGEGQSLPPGTHSLVVHPDVLARINTACGVLKSAQGDEPDAPPRRL